ncbi:L,D-transpeptidase family protein [Psychrobacter sp. P11G5]|uniref:L,D-transpeptidase family protein n=1 Tax=Psychrobacter sp. P11G5 TaxID=1699624 RepID=UPI00078D11AA|nr:L,D-transpeptidase family protein [Psychrobacter sp. P11G5]AMN67059.1 hypothetical protein AK825_04485 [Psychrobacter sp. P11G5]
MSFSPMNISKHWLIISIGLAIAVVSTSAIAHIKKVSVDTQALFHNPKAIPNTVIIDKVFVDKSARTLQLLSNNEVIKSYRIALGDSPVGHKQQEGDQRTPVGIYNLDCRNENSIAHRSIHISYPNAANKAQAEALGVNPGGDIMIHGQMNGFGHLAWINQKSDWTDGCIAVANDEMDEIMDTVALGIPIEIVE